MDGQKFSRSGLIMDQIITITRVGLNFLENSHVSPIFLDLHFQIFVTPSEFYSNFEKLLLPFDTTTWNLLAALFSIITIVIIVASFMSKSVKKIIFGRNIKRPGLNVTQIFFGIGQTRLPRESILRFILIFFVLFCLIMRTCYQSKMFDFITTDMRKPPPETIEDVIDRGYTFVISNENKAFHDYLVSYVRNVNKR